MPPSKSTIGDKIWDALLAFATANMGRKPTRAEAVEIINRMVKETTTLKSGTLCDADFLAHLEAQECYRFIDVKRELGKCQNWGTVNGKAVTRRRFIAWLNRAEKTIGYDARGKSSADAARPQRPAKPTYTLESGPTPKEWRYAIRYQINIGSYPGSEDDLCSRENWAELPEHVRAAILKVI